MAENNHGRYIVAANGFVYRDGKYLIIERGPQEWAPGTLCAPGGGVEAHSQDLNLLEDEVRREVLEETGVTVGERLAYGFSKAFLTDTGVPILSVYFLCEYGSGEPHIADPDEVASVEWLTHDEIVADKRSPDWMQHDVRTIEQVRQRLVNAGDLVFA